MSFNVMNILNDSTKEELFVEKKEDRIHFRLIDKNKNNSFPIVEIKELANSLINFGLQQNLVVRKNQERYELLSGERRLTAIEYIFSNELEISDERREELEKPFCRIENENIDPTLSELLIYETNLQARDNSDWAKLGLVKKYIELLNACEEKGLIKNISGQLKEIIADKFNMSERTAVKYNVVLKDNDEEILKDIEQGTLSINKAYDKVQKQKKDVDTPLNEWEQVEEHMQLMLRTKVKFKAKSFTVSFDNEEELNRILEMMNLNEE